MKPLIQSNWGLGVYQVPKNMWNQDQKLTLLVEKWYAKWSEAGKFLN